MSTAEVVLDSSHPSVATKPACASMPNTSRCGNMRHMARNQSGCFNAKVPITSRASPAASSRRIVSSVRTPPPNSHGTPDGANNRLDARQG